MNINEIKQMADDHVECDFAEVQMYTLIHIAKSIEQLMIALDRLEYATELIKMYVGYADSHLSETEKILLKLYKEFLGEKK